MPEINRFRRGDSFEKSRANECLFGASAFAEFLTCMASLREGSRGGEVTAMGGWQWGSGMALPAYARTTEGGWIPASVFAGAGSPWGDGDGSPHTRGQRVGGIPVFRGEAYRGGRGWVRASARTTGGGIPAYVLRAGLTAGGGDGSPHPRGQRVGGGFPLPSSRGRLSVGGMGMGPRIREDNGRGWIPASVFAGAGSLCGGWGWVPAYARTTEGGWVPASRGQRVGRQWGTGGSRTAPTEGEYCRARGSPPSPVFTRAGSNLPPSRGKGFVGDERAIFIVMTCGGCATLRSEGGREGVVVWVVQLWHSESVR